MEVGSCSRQQDRGEIAELFTGRQEERGEIDELFTGRQEERGEIDELEREDGKGNIKGRGPICGL
jgi:hypothetical protein